MVAGPDGRLARRRRRPRRRQLLPARGYSARRQRLRAGRAEVKLTPSGTALAMSYALMPWDLSKLGGRRDGLVRTTWSRRSTRRPGALLFEWHALGSIGLWESYRPTPRARGKVHDPYHLNSIDLDADGNLVLSARHSNAVYKLDRQTADVIWRLGGKRSDFTLRRARASSLGAASASDPTARGRFARGARANTEKSAMFCARQRGSRVSPRQPRRTRWLENEQAAKPGASDSAAFS